MENIDNENLFDGMEETPMDVVSWDGSVKFWEYEDLWASDYLESTNNPKIESNDTDTAYNDELELQYWDANVVEEYNYWKMKKWYDKEQEVLWEVLQKTSPKNNKQTKMLLEETLLDDYQNLAA
jgi:hypothetical protein